MRRHTGRTAGSGLGWLALVLGLALAAAGPALANTPDSREPSYVYIGVHDGDAPFVDYEGDGAVHAMGIRQPKPGDPFSIILEVVPTGIWPLGAERKAAPEKIIRLEGEARRIGKDRFRLAGELRCDRPVVLQFVRMLRDGDASGETFPELSFGAGRHQVRFDARLVGWLER